MVWCGVCVRTSLRRDDVTVAAERSHRRFDSANRRDDATAAAVSIHVYMCVRDDDTVRALCTHLAAGGGVQVLPPRDTLLFWDVMLAAQVIV